LKNLTIDAIILSEVIAMARRETQQLKKRTTVVATTVALPLSPPAAPAQPTTGAGFDFGRPVSVDEFLEQLKRDDHKRFIRAWQLACKFGIGMTDAFAILEKQDGALVSDKSTADASLPLKAENFDEPFWHQFVRQTFPRASPLPSQFWVLPCVPALRAPTFRLPPAEQ
jgi:hypothetical protein